MLQGLLFFFALIALISAQGPADKGGCCFYSQFNFQDEIACSSDSFNISDVLRGRTNGGIKSFFCTEFYSAAITNKATVSELVACGDVVNETTSPIPVDSVSVGPCLQRRCCLYSGKNKDGNELCMYDDAIVKADLDESQKDGNFAVAECTEDWKATLTHGGGKTISVDCGVTLDLSGTQKFEKIVLTRCPSVQSNAMFESVDDFQADQVFEEIQADQAFTDEFQADQALVDEFQADQLFVDEFQADQAFVDEFQADQAFVDEFQADQAFVDEFQADQAFVDEFQADQAFVDEFQADQFFEDANHGDGDADVQAIADSFDQTFEDQAFVDNNADLATNAQGSQFSSGSAVLGSVIAIVAAVALLM